MTQTEIRPFNDQTTYVGTLDDVVYRYPWGPGKHGRMLDLEALRSQLVTGAIYGKSVIINDGYLIANPLLAKDLDDTALSLISTLVKGNAAYIYARGGTAKLAEGLERSASDPQKAVAVHQRLMADEVLWSRVKEGLRRLEFFSGRNVLPWPKDKNMGHVFYLLMKGIAGGTGIRSRITIPDALRDDYDSVFRLFEERLDLETFSAARTVWEEAAWLHCEGYDIDPEHLGTAYIPIETLREFPQYHRVRLLMNIANEMYHLAQSSGAAKSIADLKDHPLATNGRTVGVATALVENHEGLITSNWSAGDPSTSAAVQQLMISIPPELSFTGNFSFVEQLDGSSEVREARNTYLSSMHALANERGEHPFDSAYKARNDYLQVLARIMAPHVRRSRTVVYADRLFDLLMASATAALSPIDSWALGIGVDSLKNLLVERVSARRLEVSMMNEGIENAQRHFGQIRDKGLYMGPLDGESVTRLMDKVIAPPGGVSGSKPNN